MRGLPGRLQEIQPPHMQDYNVILTMYSLSGQLYTELSGLQETPPTHMQDYNVILTMYSLSGQLYTELSGLQETQLHVQDNTA